MLRLNKIMQYVEKKQAKIQIQPMLRLNAQVLHFLHFVLRHSNTTNVKVKLVFH